MKKNQKSKLKISKVAISKITFLVLNKVKGGTIPIDPRPMTQNPDGQTVCYAIK